MVLHLRRHSYYELIFSLLIIGLLASIAIQVYSVSAKKARVVTFTGELRTVHSMYVYHAIHGIWPDNFSEYYQCSRYMLHIH